MTMNQSTQTVNVLALADLRNKPAASRHAIVATESRKNIMSLLTAK